MQNTRAKIMAVAPYTEGSEAVRVTAAPVRFQDRQVSFDEANPVECVFLPLPWNEAGVALEYANSMVGEVGKFIFNPADEEPTGVNQPDVPADALVVEFFLPGQ